MPELSSPEDARIQVAAQLREQADAETPKVRERQRSAGDRAGGDIVILDGDPEPDIGSLSRVSDVCGREGRFLLAAEERPDRLA